MPIFTEDGVGARSLFFLRNDVYELLLDRTADRGKEQKVLVDWRDPEALKQVVALRISASLGEGLSSLDELWPRIAVRHIHGEDSYRSEEHTSELQSLMSISYAVFCLTKKKTKN